ncbi:MAG: hypothetical protein KKB59_18850 [Spirochaetes bacterium]|nr:hypothetical protein [Spirochaetota bacterium]
MKGLTDKEAKLIVASVERVCTKLDINYLTESAYQFITLHMSFIAHYNSHGFKAEYDDLRKFLSALQTGELTKERDWNLRKADRQETDVDFLKWYGEENQKNVAFVIREIVKIARKHEAQAEAAEDRKEKAYKITLAKVIANKYGLTLVTQ